MGDLIGFKMAKGNSLAKLYFFFSPPQCLCHVVFIQSYLSIWYVFLLFSLERLYYDRVAKGTDPLLGTTLVVSLQGSRLLFERSKLQICHCILWPFFCLLALTRTVSMTNVIPSAALGCWCYMISAGP